MRANTSEVPPAGNGTTILIGLEGKLAAVCAKAEALSTSAAAAVKAAKDFLIMTKKFPLGE
jgi:hypothetical protein